MQNNHGDVKGFRAEITLKQYSQIDSSVMAESIKLLRRQDIFIGLGHKRGRVLVPNTMSVPKVTWP